MREDIARRFAYVDKLWAMPYGDSMAISGMDARLCWPPTGDEDRTMEGAFRAMALASGGNRQEESLTTKQRIERDLEAGGFSVEQHPMSTDWVVQRRLSACPHCRGAGYKKVPREVSREISPADLSDVMAETYTVDRIECDHRPTPVSMR